MIAINRMAFCRKWKYRGYPAPMKERFTAGSICFTGILSYKIKRNPIN